MRFGVVQFPGTNCELDVLHAVETLGAATVVCVDKTGTLTLNQLSVAMLFTAISYGRMARAYPSAGSTACCE